MRDPIQVDSSGAITFGAGAIDGTRDIWAEVGRAGEAESVHVWPEPVLHPVALERDKRYRFALAFADVAAALIALVVAISTVGGSHLYPIALLGLPLVVIVSKITGMYDRDQLLVRKTTIHEIPAIFNHATLYTLLCWLFAGWLVVDGDFGPSEALALWVGLFGFTIVFRRAARWIACELSAAERLLLVGDAGTYNRIKEKLEIGHINAGLVGRLSLQRTAQHRFDERAIDEGALRELIAALDVHRLLIVPSQSSPAATLELVRAAKATGIRVSLVPQVMDVVGNAVVFDEVLGVTLLGVRSFDLSRTARIAKRSMDIAGSLAGLVLLSPLFAAVGIAIKLDSPGPVFFRQARVGRDNRVFRIFKFRSMVVDAEDRKQDLFEGGMNGGLFKIEDDPRATRVGRFLRSTSLDELPQLVNVLRGEMSLVGPRPLIASEDSTIKGFDRERLRLTPGMTGQWQLMSSRVTLDEMVKLDYLYVTSWSLMDDVGILLRTIRHVALRKGV